MFARGRDGPTTRFSERVPVAQRDRAVCPSCAAPLHSTHPHPPRTAAYAPVPCLDHPATFLPPVEAFHFPQSRAPLPSCKSFLTASFSASWSQLAPPSAAFPSCCYCHFYPLPPSFTTVVRNAGHFVPRSPFLAARMLAKPKNQDVGSKARKSSPAALRPTEPPESPLDTSPAPCTCQLRVRERGPVKDTEPSLSRIVRKHRFDFFLIFFPSLRFEC